MSPHAAHPSGPPRRRCARNRSSASDCWTQISDFPFSSMEKTEDIDGGLSEKLAQECGRVLRNVTKYFELLHRKQPTATVRAPRPPPTYIPHVLMFSRRWPGRGRCCHGAERARSSSAPSRCPRGIPSRPARREPAQIPPPRQVPTPTFAFILRAVLNWGREGKRRAAEPGAAQHRTTARCSDHLVPRPPSSSPRPPLVSLKFSQLWRAQGLA